MDPFSAAIMGGTMLATGTMSSLGAHSANSANKKIAREQMNFQRIMAETQHQREVADLRKAGLNPLLSAGGSGAAVPAGASTTVQNEYEPFAKHIDPLSILGIEQGRANIGKTKAETLVAGNTAANLEEQNKYIAQQIAESQAREAKIYAEVSGKTFLEAGVSLFGNGFKYRYEGYRNQPLPNPIPSTPAPAAGASSDDPWSLQVTKSLLSGAGLK